MLALDQLLRIVEADAHEVDDAIEVIIDIHIHAAIAQEAPRHLVNRTVQVVGYQRAVAEGEAVEGTLVGILRILRLLLEGFLVVMVIEAVLRAVGTLGGDKAGTIAERQVFAVDTDAHQHTCLLGESILALTVLHQQLVAVLCVRVLLCVLT